MSPRTSALYWQTWQNQWGKKTQQLSPCPLVGAGGGHILETQGLEHCGWGVRDCAAGKALEGTDWQTDRLSAHYSKMKSPDIRRSLENVLEEIFENVFAGHYTKLINHYWHYTPFTRGSIRGAHLFNIYHYQASSKSAWSVLLVCFKLALSVHHVIFFM